MSEPVARNGWRTYRFDEIAIMVNDRIDDPSKADVEYYVGLEHLDSDSLAIRRWGSPTDVEATKLRFRAGDIIFGRRRVYQRKLAVADFDGICSAHAMVLRAKSAVALPEFLPFFMQSDLFMERAKEISVGSLSPTINWKTLAKEEFTLPPLDEQRRLSGGLQAFEHCVQKYVLVEKAGHRLEASLLSEREAARTPETAVLSEVIKSSSYGSSARSNSDGKGVPILGIPNVLRGELDLSDLNWVDLSSQEIAKYQLCEGDVLVVRTNGNPNYVGRCLAVPALQQPMVFASYLIRLVVDRSRMRPEYLVATLNSPSVRALLRRHVRSSAGNYNVNTEGLRATPISLPSLERQDRLLGQLAEFDRARSKVKSRRAELRECQRRVLGAIGNE